MARIKYLVLDGGAPMRIGLITLFCLFLLAIPLPAAAQSPVAHVGVLMFTDVTGSRAWSSFAGALRERGWIEGRNLQFHIRAIEGRAERYPEFAEELVALQPGVILAVGSAGTRAVREKTDTIPIVMFGADDPVRLGFVASLARPGGNITGISNQGADVYEKAFELLMETLPGISRVMLYYTDAYPASRLCKATLEAAAPRLGLELEPVAINALAEFDAALATAVRDRPDALIVHGTPFTEPRSRDIAAFALEQRLPTFSWERGAARNGFLMSYGADVTQMTVRAAALVDKILKGAKPADIPVEQPTKFDLVINLKTASAIGIKIPRLLLGRADEVIE
jgi:putative tryptophan/tyrosine transport system substrate-binding protein